MTQPTRQTKDGLPMTTECSDCGHDRSKHHGGELCLAELGQCGCESFFSVSGAEPCPACKRPEQHETYRCPECGVTWCEEAECGAPQPGPIACMRSPSPSTPETKDDARAPTHNNSTEES